MEVLIDHASETKMISMIFDYAEYDLLVRDPRETEMGGRWDPLWEAMVAQMDCYYVYETPST